MENITTAAGLKSAIQRLEYRQIENGQRLEEDFFVVIERLKPANLIKNAMGNIVGTPNLLDNIVGGAVGLVSGYLSKKLAIGGSGNIFKKFLGTLLQFGVTSVVATHPRAITAIGQFLLKKIIRKKEQRTQLS